MAVNKGRQLARKMPAWQVGKQLSVLRRGEALSETPKLSLPAQLQPRTLFTIFVSLPPDV